MLVDPKSLPRGLQGPCRRYFSTSEFTLRILPPTSRKATTKPHSRHAARRIFQALSSDTNTVLAPSRMTPQYEARCALLRHGVRVHVSEPGLPPPRFCQTTIRTPIQHTSKHALPYHPWPHGHSHRPHHLNIILVFEPQFNHRIPSRLHERSAHITVTQGPPTPAHAYLPITPASIPSHHGPTTST